MNSTKFSSKLQEGDFLFQDITDSSLSESIRKATSGNDEFQISHLGIVVIENEKYFIIEAYDSVQKIPLETFLQRSRQYNKPNVIVGRLKKEYQKFIPKAIERAHKLLGKAYDDTYTLNNGAYYCSELVYEVFLDEKEKSLFTVKPMSFKNKQTGKVDKTWVDYFNKLNMKVPEGKLGCNPFDYSKSDKIEIIDYVSVEKSK